MCDQSFSLQMQPLYATNWLGQRNVIGVTRRVISFPIPAHSCGMILHRWGHDAREFVKLPMQPFKNIPQLFELLNAKESVGICIGSEGGQ